MLRVKICGITNVQDALLCAEAGADALGFVFYPPSPRSVSPERAQEIVAALPPFVTTVGVFVDAPLQEIESIADRVGLDWVQLHGSEPPELCAALSRRVMKAVRVGERLEFPFEDYPLGTVFLLDAYVRGRPGGTGRSFRWEMAREAAQFGPIVLAGGLKPENLIEAVRQARPIGVDVSSGVERTPGRKDPDRVRAFLETARLAERYLKSPSGH